MSDTNNGVKRLFKDMAGNTIYVLLFVAGAELMVIISHMVYHASKSGIVFQ